MDDVRTTDPQEPPDVHNGIKDGQSQNQVHQRRVEHATTTTVDNITSYRKNRKNKKKTSHKINNIHFGDDIRQEPQAQSIRIFFPNFNGLEFNTTSHTLLEGCKGMKDKQIDIVFLIETNTNWKHYKGKRHLNRIVRQHWKRVHLTTSNIDSKVKTL